MSVLVLLITAGGMVATGFMLAFIWAVRSGQFDDTHTPAVRVLLDSEQPRDSTNHVGRVSRPTNHVGRVFRPAVSAGSEDPAYKRP